MYGLLKEEDIQGLFLKSLRSSEKPRRVWVACGTCSTQLARTVLPSQPSSALQDSLSLGRTPRPLPVLAASVLNGQE